MNDSNHAYSTNTNDGNDIDLSDEAIASELIKNCYHTLLGIARENRRKANFSDTIMTEDILHDAFLKLTNKTVWQSRSQFFRTLSLAIRQVVVDHARQKLSIKRGGKETTIAYQDDSKLLLNYHESPEQIILLNDILERLEQNHKRLSMIVNARYFAAMTEAETAVALNLSERTVRRDWQLAKSWLYEKMKSET